MRDVPDPDEYTIEGKTTLQGDEVIIIKYPNSSMGVRIKTDGIYRNIEDNRREYSPENGECMNCSHDEAALNPCPDCWEASLQAAENWAANNADDLIGDQF